MVRVLLAALTLTAAAVSAQSDSARLRQTIEAHPNDIAAHDSLVALIFDADSTRRLIDNLSAQYERWIVKFPKSAGVRYGYGDLLFLAKDPRARQYLLQAVRADPHLARADRDLSLDAETRGDPAEAREWIAKAMAADTLNPEYAYDDAIGAQEPAIHAKVEAMIARFPASEYTAGALAAEADRQPSDSMRIAILEKLEARFPVDWFHRSAAAMHSLYDAYVREGSPKALALARDMLRVATTPNDQREWTLRFAYSRNVALVNALMAEGKVAAADAIASQMSAPGASDIGESLALLRAAVADSAGETRRAFDTLVVYDARTPTDRLQEPIQRDAGKLGLTTTQTDSAIWFVRDRDATPAPAFRLRSYSTGASVSLGDYRGRVVLLTFWFPACGPCRAEFPYLQAAADRFQARGLAYVAINVLPNESPFVLPFMNGYHYTFTALDGSESLADQYHARGEPANYLIDANGRIVFGDFSARNAREQRTLERMIASVLERSSGTAR